MFEQETTERIKEIWSEFHSDPHKMAIGSTLSVDDHDTISLRVKNSPNYLFPVFASKEAYYLMFSQFQDNMFFLTFLDDYRNNPDTAQPYMTIRMFDDLASSKDICLKRADHLPNLSSAEAQVLQSMVTNAYLDNEYFTTHIETFSAAPEKFDFEKAVSGLYDMNAAALADLGSVLRPSTPAAP